MATGKATRDRPRAPEGMTTIQLPLGTAAQLREIGELRGRQLGIRRLSYADVLNYLLRFWEESVNEQS